MILDDGSDASLRGEKLLVTLDRRLPPGFSSRNASRNADAGSIR